MAHSLTPRGSPPVPLVPAEGKARALPLVEARAARVRPETIEKVRSRLEAAACNLEGKDIAAIFRAQDKDHPGFIGWPEFSKFCRRVLRISAEDCHLRAVFGNMDFDGSGEVSIDELVAFLQDPVERMRSRLRVAAQCVGGERWVELIQEYDSDGCGSINFQEFYMLCRSVLRILDSSHLLHQVFRHLDANGSGEISVEELIAFIRIGVQDDSNSISSGGQGVEEEERRQPTRPTSAQPLRSRPMSGRPMSARPLPAQIEQHREELHEGLIERMRTRLKGAAYTLAGQDWRRLFHDQDTARPGWLNFSEFRALCRGMLRLSDDSEHLQLVFSHLDGDGVGEVAVETLVDFVSPAAVSVEACMELLGQANWVRRSCRPRARSAR